MRTAIVTILLTVLVVATSQQKLNYLDVQGSSVTIEQIIDKFAELQSDIYKNVFTHFMEKTIKEWRNAGRLEREIREDVLKLVTDVNGPLFAKLTEFMQKRLFEKLEMGLLTDSLQQQIKTHPENFYLTFDIYDLLFD